MINIDFESLALLSMGQMHLVLVPYSYLNAHYSSLDAKSVLNNEELSYLESLHCRPIYSRFLMTRFFLKSLLSYYLKIPVQQVKLIRQDSGKLMICEDLFFNLSHSKDFLLFGFSLDSDVGVDVQFRTDSLKYTALARRFFSKADYDYFLSLSFVDQRLFFYQSWVYKEAYVKYYGHRLLPLLSRLITPTISLKKLFDCMDGLQCYMDGVDEEYAFAAVCSKAIRQVHFFDIF